MWRYYDVVLCIYHLVHSNFMLYIMVLSIIENRFPKFSSFFSYYLCVDKNISFHSHIYIGFALDVTVDYLIQKVNASMHDLDWLELLIEKLITQCLLKEIIWFVFLQYGYELFYFYVKFLFIIIIFFIDQNFGFFYSFVNHIGRRTEERK